jgi:dUTPase
LPKLCELSNGIDIPFQKSIKLEPHETKKVPLGIKFLMPKKLCALLMNKSSALIKYKVKVVLGLIDYGFSSELQVVLENTLNKPLELPEGVSVCQLLLLPSKVPKLTDSWIEPTIKRGSFGSTGQNFIKNKVENSSSHLNLIEMASDHKISVTSFGINIEPQPNILKCYFTENPNIREGLDKKVYFRLNLAGYRVTTCVDSGSDLTLMQESLYTDLFGSTKYLCNSIVTEVTSYSSNQITVLGEINTRFTLENSNSYSNPITITVIKDIPGSVTPFIFGNDSLKSCLATLGYTGEKSNPQPELIFKCPIEQSVRVYYASPLEIVSIYAD